MKVTTEELESCEVLLTIEIEPADEQDLLNKAARRISREVRIPGFRPGKAPFNTVVRRFGMKVVQQEALEKVSEKLVTDALDEADIKPFAQIELEEIDWGPLVIKVRIPVKPKVELGNYRDVRLEVEPVEVTEDDIEETLKNLQEQHATWSPVERPSEIGDLLSMSITGKDGDDVVIEDEAAEYELYDPANLADDQPDITTPLLGLSAGDEKTFTVTYPGAFPNDKLAGKDITFTVDVSGVKVKELDPIDDDFAQQVSEVDTLDELREIIKENLTKQRERNRDHELGHDMLAKLVETALQLEWPKALEEEQIDEEVKLYEQRAKESGMTLSSFLKLEDKTEEALREETRANVIERLKNGLVLSKVAELEKLMVTESEILEQAKLISDMYGTGDQLWRFILNSKDQQGMIKNDLLSSKAIRRLAAIAKGEAPEPGEPEAEADEEKEGAEKEPVLPETVGDASPLEADEDEANSPEPEEPAADASAEERVTTKEA